MFGVAAAGLAALAYRAEFWLAVIPPILAITVENFNPINGRVVRANADRDLRDRFQALDPDDREIVLETLEKSGEAIGEIAGLAPTLISCVASGFAVLHEMASPFWPAVIYVLTFIVIALYILSMLSGLTYAQIGGLNAAIPLPWGDLDLRWKRTAVVSFTIYVANALLIVLAVCAFAGKHEAPAGESSAPAAALAPGGAAMTRPLPVTGDDAATKLGDFRLADMQQQIDDLHDEIALFRPRSSPFDAPPESEALLGPVGWQRIQLALYRRGFDPGAIDGVPGRATRAAIRKYQRTARAGASGTGHLTTPEIIELWSSPGDR